MTVRLIGVKNNPGKEEMALNYLENKIKGQRVFLKYDQVKYDEKKNLMCYLYLKNKTFINAHLIKNGLMSADENQAYKYKDKFERIGADNG